jgi:hypothetical protein
MIKYFILHGYFFIVIVHSCLNASTGFLVAAFILCQLTAIPNASNPASAKIHQLSEVL